MDREPVDVGVVVPLKEEFDQLVEVFGELEKFKDEDFRLTNARPVGTFWRLRGPDNLTVIAVVCKDMGPEWAAVATERLLHRFDVGIVCQIGIAGALSNHLQLGDVVVPIDIWAYHQSGKVTDVDGEIQWALGSRDLPLPDGVIEVVRNMIVDPDTRQIYEKWRDEARNRRPMVVGGLEENVHVRPRPVCHVIEKLASGPFVIASPSFWNKHMASSNRLSRAVEMEAAGVGAALRAWDKPLLVVRGISDFADGRKSLLDEQGGGQWREYAARNAASMLWQLLPLCAPVVKPMRSSLGPSKVGDLPGRKSSLDEVPTDIKGNVLPPLDVAPSDDQSHAPSSQANDSGTAARETLRPASDEGGGRSIGEYGAIVAHTAAEAGYNVGDRVEHANFGEGLVIEVASDEDGDFVLVRFDDIDVGVKRLRRSRPPAPMTSIGQRERPR